MDTTKDIEDMAGIRLPDAFSDILRKVTKVDVEHELSRRGHTASTRRGKVQKKRPWKYNKKLNARKYVLPKAMR